MNISKIKITNNESWQRFDRFLRKFFKKYPEIKLSDIFARIRKWYIKINWKKVKQNYRLKTNDEIIFDPSIQKKINLILSPKDVKKNNINIKTLEQQIIYEDENRIFRNKPAGIVVHPWNKHINDLTLNDYLDVYIQHKIKQWTFKNISPTFKPSFCFRLDKDTSWIIVAAKNYEALKYLNELIKNRKTDKYYIAIVKWKAPSHLIIDYPLFRWFNKKFWRAQSFVNWEKWLPAKTEIWKLQTIKDKFLWYISLIKIKLYTGRMHQIRAHLWFEWYPIIWDIMYGDTKINKIALEKYKINRQLLHSRKYGFFDKFKNKYLEITSDLPTDFTKLKFKQTFFS